MLTKENKQLIVKKIVEKIGYFKCPICHNDSFTIADGYIVNTLQDDLSRIQLGGSFLPSVALVCNKCGFTSIHNAKILGVDINEKIMQDSN